MVYYSISLYHLYAHYMKSSEFHRIIKRNGWVCIRTRGSHYMYLKNGTSYSVPFHASKEVPEGLRKKIIRDMKLNIN
ncbi:type II toxin-antitoxin system HicA family toxin [Dyadobacter sp. MSC1_007]|uniref:type II toxin-antitoxin system HicA family toxin n=1 Tax=Dyadobacter sp. MSC1_007 TaxID=2909264 RepID=UPI0038D41738